MSRHGRAMFRAYNMMPPQRGHVAVDTLTMKGNSMNNTPANINAILSLPGVLLLLEYRLSSTSPMEMP